MNPYYRVYSTESSAAEHALTMEDAQARAEELAAKHPGRCFEILRCVGYASTSKASTFWMDGEGPPEKPRYRAMERGEIFQDGDEYRHPGEQWRKVPRNSFGLELLGFFVEIEHRRPL